jgi:hypothetical protein
VYKLCEYLVNRGIIGTKKSIRENYPKRGIFGDKVSKNNNKQYL